jgi:hypothetical protein
VESVEEGLSPFGKDLYRVAKAELEEGMMNVYVWVDEEVEEVGENGLDL